MNNIERIRELIRDLERGCDKMSGGMNLEIARQMLVVSECITASLQGYLFKFMTGYTPARHRSRPNEAVSHAQGFRSGPPSSQAE